MICFLKRLIIAVAASGSLCGGASAQDVNWPTRPVTIIVGYPAGGATDVTARLLAEKLSQRFGQSFIVENRPGAGGAVAAARLKSMTPDGYNLMFGSSGTLTIAPKLRKDLPYDPIKHFTPIGLVSSYPYFLVVPSSSPLSDLGTFLKRARDPASRMSYASAGMGAVNHLAAEWFKNDAKIYSVHIPYGGDAAAVMDLVAGRVDWAFLSGAAALPQVKAGKLRILASADDSRRPGSGDIPLLKSTFPGFSAGPWNGLMAPAGLPQSIVSKLNSAVNEILADANVVKSLANVEQYPLTGGADDFVSKIRSESLRWEAVIKASNIKVD